MTGESTRKAKIGRVYTYNGLNRVETDEAGKWVISLRSLVSTISISAKL